MTCALYEIRSFAFIRFHCEDGTVTCAFGEIRIFAFIRIDVNGSTVACALSDIDSLVLYHTLHWADPLHDDVLLMICLAKNRH